MLATDALGRGPPELLPAALKKASSFAPGRHAKLAGTQIVAILETDAEFRDRLAIQVRTLVPEMAKAIDSGAPSGAGDPVEVAAVAFRGLLSASPRREGGPRASRLRQIEAAGEELKETRQKHREEMARLKAENAELRHRLGDPRARMRLAHSRLEDARRQVTELERAATVAAAQNGRGPATPDPASRSLRLTRTRCGGQPERNGAPARCVPGCCWTRLLDTAQGL